MVVVWFPKGAGGGGSLGNRPPGGGAGLSSLGWGRTGGWGGGGVGLHHVFPCSNTGLSKHDDPMFLLCCPLNQNPACVRNGGGGSRYPTLARSRPWL